MAKRPAGLRAFIAAFDDGNLDLEALRAFDRPVYFALGGRSKEGFKVLVIHLGRVPVIDATGLVALENTISGAIKARKDVIIAGPLPKPRQIFDKAKLEKKHVGLQIAKDIDAAVAIAEQLLADRKTPLVVPTNPG